MRRIALFAMASVFAHQGLAEDACGTANSFDAWTQCRLLRVVIAQQTQRNPTKQVESPAISSSSTSLVDHTSLADFATAALDVAGFGSNSSQSPSGTTTISAYAIYSALLAQNPLDAGFYNDHVNWRRLTFSVGADTPAASSSAAGVSGSGTTSSKVAGASFLILNGRDLATKANQREIRAAANTAAGIAQIMSNCRGDVVDVLYAAYGSRLGPTPTDLDERVNQRNLLQEFDESKGGRAKEVLTWLGQDSVTSAKVEAIFNQYAPALLEEKGDIEKKVQKFRNAAQFSISGQAAIADNKTQNSDYRAEVVFEKGLQDDLNFAANGSFDYVNSPAAGGDTRGGRAAVDLQYLFLTAKSKASARKPVSLHVSGEGDWFQSFHPSYVGQIGLTIPLVAGVDLPLSFSYASSTNLLHETHAVGKFGLTFDLSRIAAALSKQ